MNIQKGVPLAPFTTFGIGGPADYFIIVISTQELIEATKYAKDKNLSFFVLGTGANILVGDKGFRGLVIKNEARHHSEPGTKDNNVYLTAESGITIAELIKITAEKGLSGLEHFAGIPSTLGGALWQNLHFLSPDRKETVFIGEIVQGAELLEIKNQSASWRTKIKNVTKEYFNFSYDYSILHDTHDIVLSATLRLTKEDPAIIRQTISENLSWRKEKHPENAVRTSAGSVFKKIPASAKASAGKEGGAGRFIDRVGLKGYQIGGARISEKHANFIINTGGASASDVRRLIDLVQKTVKEKLGFQLETEISFVGEF